MQSPQGRPIDVFLVDDHRAVLWGLERLVESAAPVMRLAGTASTRAEMLDKLDSIKPDVIILDLDLSGESSLDCFEQIGRRGSAQVLVLTGTSDTDVHQLAVVRGARGVVHKQESAAVLLRAIEKVHQGELWLDRAALGRVMTTFARGGLKVDPEAEKLARLTPKERQIIVTVAREKGARNKVIADKLHISEHTLRNHLTTIYSKLEVQGRMELYLYATERPQLLAVH